MLDCIIIGSGVAGISAALTLKANQKTFLLFGQKELSEKIEKAESIRNYPSFLGGSGKNFVTALQQQLEQEEIPIQAERVSGVYALKDKYSVMTQEGGVYESKSVILACGVESVKQIQGEEAYIGRGVSYCATCDGFLYKGKTIAVLCTTKRLEHEIGYLAKIAKNIYLIPMYKDVEITGENITVIRKMPKKIEGTKRVEKLLFATPPTPRTVRRTPRRRRVYVTRERLACGACRRLANGKRTRGDRSGYVHEFERLFCRRGLHGQTLPVRKSGRRRERSGAFGQRIREVKNKRGGEYGQERAGNFIFRSEQFFRLGGNCA